MKDLRDPQLVGRHSSNYSRSEAGSRIQTRVKVTVQYFAILREQRGLSSETLETGALTAGDLYAELRAKHSFSLKPELVKASVNLQLRPLETVLRDGDQIVFIPPVAGG